MNSHPDPRRHEPAHAAVERRLERLSGAAPHLRHRVLVAVDDVLAEQRPTVQGGTGGAVPGWAWAAAAAISAAFAMPWLAGTAPVHPVERLTLVARMQLAGVADDDLLAATSFARSPQAGHLLARRIDHVPAIPAANLTLDVRRLLEEEL